MSLFTTIPEIKKYIAIDDNAQMITLQPYIAEAEELYLKDLLGKDFLTIIQAAYTLAGGVVASIVSDEVKALMPYVQRCLAYYMQVQAIPNLLTTFGELGVRVHGGDENSQPAMRWQVEKLQFTALKNGDLHADKLLEYLEENATTSNDLQGWFDNAKANTINSGFIIYGTAIASKHIDINNSRRVYLKLRHKMQEIETRIVPKLIGKEQYDEVVTQLKAGTLSNENKELVTLIEPIICKRALYMQAQFMRIQITENGILMYSGTDEIFKGLLASDADVKVLKAQLLDDELGYRADEVRLEQFILDNIADYPLIKASTAYTVQPDPGPTFRPSNSADNKHFIA